MQESEEKNVSKNFIEREECLRKLFCINCNVIKLNSFSLEQIRQTRFLINFLVL